jgi:hypothetical protein
MTILIIQTDNVVFVNGTPKRFCAMLAILFNGKPSTNLLVPIHARVPADAWIRGNGGGGSCSAVFGD